MRRLAVLGLTTALASCGTIYVPQSFEPPRGGYGYHRTEHVDIEVIPMTFVSAAEANADGYAPRSLPDVFDETDPLITISTRDRIAQAGLDAIEPALEFAPLPSPPQTYDAGSQILPPGLRREDVTPAAVVDVAGGGVATPPPVGLRDRSVGSAGYGGGLGGVAGYSVDGGAGQGFGETGYDEVEISAAYDTRAALSGLEPPLSPPRPAARVQLNPPPRIAAEPYRIGPGDVIGLLSRLQPLDAIAADPASFLADTAKNLRVQGDGAIFIPQVGAVDVGGLTLAEARRLIFDKLIDRDLDFDFGVEILEFGSQSVAVSGPRGAKLLPITVRPLTLGEAIVAVGGVDGDPSDTVVRVLRDGSIYEIPAEDLLTSSDLASRILAKGDAISIAPIEDVEGALAYFDQRLRMIQLEQAASDRERTLAREARADARDERAEQRSIAAEERARIANIRAEEGEARARIQFDIAMETYRLEAERLRQEAAIAREAAQRDADAANETARIANLAARQEYLDRLRTLEDANRAALRTAEQDRRATLIANANESARERGERRALLELELREERARLELLAQQREQARALFQMRVSLGAIQKDYVTVAGELKSQTIFPLPFGGVVTLNRVIYEAAGGLNVSTGNSREIYVIRRPAAGARIERLVAYHLDASNAADLAVATLFEMRPNDVVFVNPQPVTNWNRALSQLIPSTNFLFSTASSISGLGSN